VRSGRVLALPAVMPVRSYPVRVEDGVVKVGLG
jgi:nitrite reductase/ring-hydroxylating ferredoxin subunit